MFLETVLIVSMIIWNCVIFVEILGNKSINCFIEQNKAFYGKRKEIKPF